MKRRGFFKFMGLTPLVVPALISQPEKQTIREEGSIRLVPAPGGSFVIGGKDGKAFAFNEDTCEFEEATFEQKQPRSHMIRIVG